MDQVVAFPELDLAPLETDDLPPRDAALAHAIYDGVLRHWTALEFLLGAALRQPFGGLEPAVRAILLAGATQLLVLDRVPPHAVLNDSVEIAKRRVRPGAGALVNAVLRKMVSLRGPAVTRPADWAARRDVLPLGDGRSRQLAAPVLPDAHVDRLAVMTGHPRWLLERWRAAELAVSDLALHSVAWPPTILNTAHSAIGPPGVTPHSAPGHHVFTGTRAALAALLEAHPEVWVQDPASARAVVAVRHLTPRLIVDLCAGQGTKTRQLAAIFPGASIIATDTDHTRLRTLTDLWRGHPRVIVRPTDSATAESRGRADLVLLDVPCSNTGVLARRVEARYRCSPVQLERLTSIQKGIIDAGASLLTPSGALLYSTCSIDPDENDRQARYAVTAHRLTLRHESLTLPAGLPGDAPAVYHDGSYHALLTRG